MTTGTLNCAGKDTIIRTLRYERVEEIKPFNPSTSSLDLRVHWTYKVFCEMPNCKDSFGYYHAEFVQSDELRVMSRDMQASHDHFRELGIPEATILYMALDHIVVSSSSTAAELLVRESRGEHATKGWERLRTAGYATLDGDRYATV